MRHGQEAVKPPPRDGDGAGGPGCLEASGTSPRKDYTGTVERETGAFGSSARRLGGWGCATVQGEAIE